LILKAFYQAGRQEMLKSFMEAELEQHVIIRGP
jgi:hypothetical protein